MVAVRDRVRAELTALLDEALGDAGWAAAWGVVRADESAEPWERGGEHIEHMCERSWVKMNGDVMTIVHPEGGAPIKLRAATYWNRRRWWEGDWSDDGRRFVTSLYEALKKLEAGEVHGGGHVREAKMCWANVGEYEDIMVDVGKAEGQMFGDLANLSDRYEWGCTLEDPGEFTGGGRGGAPRVRQDGLDPTKWRGQMVTANPEFDRERGGADMVERALRLGATAKRAYVNTALFDGAGYEELAVALGGRVLLGTPAGTWSYVRDSYWKGVGGKAEGDGRRADGTRGYLPSRAGVLMFDNSAEGDTEVDVSALERHLTAWWASRAPPGHATELRARAVREGWGGWPAWLKWWDETRPKEDQGAGWGWGRDCRGGGGAWGRCGGWDPELIGGFGYAPRGFPTVLQGLGMEAAEARVLTERMEGVLYEATREIWGLRNSAHRKEETLRGITEVARRDNAAAAEYRRQQRGGGGRTGGARREGREEEVSEGEPDEGTPGEVTYNDVGQVLTRRCWDCTRLHEGRERCCRVCGVRLPRRRKKRWNPKGKVRVEREGDVTWRTAAHQMGGRLMDMKWDVPRLLRNTEGTRGDRVERGSGGGSVGWRDPVFDDGG